ncbi:MAG: DUF3822 family protein [Tangfeifania sp.]
MHELIKDPSFDLKRTSEYTLSIQVSLDGFSFSLVRIYDNRLVGLKNVPAKISTEKFIARRFSEWIQSEEIFNHQFSDVRVQYNTGNFTLVPNPFFKDGKQNELAGMLFEQEVTSQVVSNFDEISGIQLLFTMPVSLHNETTGKFGNCKVVHPALALAKKYPLDFRDNEKGVLLYFSKDNFILLLFSEDKLLLANRFNFSHANDVVYYLTAVLDQQKIIPRDTKIYLSGEIFPESQPESLLRKYFINTEFWHPKNPMNTEIFGDKLHRFITLL